MTVTPKISVEGMLAVLGGSASKTNLLVPAGTGPTSSESSSWSCSALEWELVHYLASGKRDLENVKGETRTIERNRRR